MKSPLLITKFVSNVIHQPCLLFPKPSHMSYLYLHILNIYQRTDGLWWHLKQHSIIAIGLKRIKQSTMTSLLNISVLTFHEEVDCDLKICNCWVAELWFAIVDIVLQYNRRLLVIYVKTYSKLSNLIIISCPFGTIACITL